MISKEAFDEFKKIYKEEFNEDISDEYAMEVGTNLLNLFNHIYRPIKKSWVEELEAREKRHKDVDKPVFHK